MKRLHLFEFEDQPWLPSILRRFATDYLRVVQTRMRVHGPITDILTEILAANSTQCIVDLCSGSGGALLDLVADLKLRGGDIAVILTDRYPHPDLGDLPNGVRMHAQPVDARDVPPDLVGCRTMFNALHHFTRKDAVRVLESAAIARQPIGIFEMPERRPLAALSAFLIPIMVLAMTPLIRPFRWSRIALTYVVPVVPTLCWWDGLISQLRAYTACELQELADVARTDGYVWKSGSVQVTGVPIRIKYLTGVPSP